MRNLLLTLALLLAGSGVAFADGIPQVVNSQSGDGREVWTIVVFNDSGGTIQSGEIVVWDTADPDVSDLGRRYVTISETDSDASTAGVIIQTCPNQSQCDMAILGITKVRCMDAGDAVTAGDLVSNSSIDGGKCGDHTAAADNRAIGTALESGGGTDYEYIDVFLYPADGQ